MQVGKEPTFTIRARDDLIVATLTKYAFLCENEGLVDQAAEVDKALEEIIHWRATNPELCKLPNHKHIPVKER
jgi:hypothetical protein